MNCIKCPIFEECKVVGRTQNVFEYSQGMSVPIKIEPYDKAECHILKLLKVSKSDS